MRSLIFSKLFFILFLLVLGLEAKMLTRIQVIMGTFITLSLEKEDEVHLQKAFRIFKDIDESLSSYKPQSDISLLNLHKGTQINPYTYEALFLSKKYYKDTNGYFDISIGSITKDLFSFGENERVPTAKEMSNALISIDGLVLTKEEAQISKGMKIDLGGMGKGFGVDKVREYLRAQKILKGIIAASGDIRCLNTCAMKIQDPFSDGIISSFDTIHKDMGISTSGNYNRYVESTKNNHLINPKKKISQDAFISITLISSLASSDLDAYTTAVSVMPKEVAYAFLKSIDVGYIILQSDLKMIYSSNISKYVKNLCIKYTHEK